MNKLKVYIASPYTKGDHVENVNIQMDMYSELLDLGYLPFAPLYTHYIHVRHRKDYDTWMDVDYNWIEVCDVLLRLPGESGGADLEVDLAKKVGIPVFYSVEELEAYKKNIDNMIYKVYTDSGSILINAMNYEYDNGFFHFYYDVQALGRINVASIPEYDVKRIALNDSIDKEEITSSDLEVFAEKEWKKLEKMSTRASIVRDLLSLKDTNEQNFFQKDWLMKNIMKLTDEEIEENKKHRNR